MNEKKIRREIRVCSFGGWTSLVGAFVPIAGAIIIMAAAELSTRKLDFLAEMLVLTLACLFLVLALGLAMCGAMFFINRRQGEHSLYLMEMIRAGQARRVEGT